MPVTLVTRESTTTTSPPGMGDTYDTDSVTLTPERGVVVSSAAVEMVSARVAGGRAGRGGAQRRVLGLEQSAPGLRRKGMRPGRHVGVPRPYPHQVRRVC